MANTKVTGDVIANGTISTVHLADDAITAAKLDSTATGITFADLTVDTDTLYVDATNNRVGIGTTSPSEALEVAGSIRIDNGASFTSYQIYRDNIKYGDIGGGGNQFTIQAANNKNINLFDDNGVGLTVKDGGNVGIGKSDPSGGYGKQLWVSSLSGEAEGQLILEGNSGSTNQNVGTIVFVNNGNNISIINGYTDSPNVANSGGLKFQTYSNGSLSERMRIDSSGNVNIATGRLRIDRGSDEGSQLNLWADSNGFCYIAGYDLEIKTGSNNARSTKVKITPTGNVGIGETNPTKKIDLYQSNASFGAADFRHVNGNRILVNPSYNYYDAYNHIFRGLNGTDTRLTIDNSGGVSITPTTSTSFFYGADGTNSYINFETNNIDATVQLYAGYSSGGYFSIGTKDGGGTLSERMRITSGGNIGISGDTSAWALGKTIQINGNYGTINYNSVSAILGIINAYYNGSAYIRQNVGYAGSIDFNTAVSGGGFAFRTENTTGAAGDTVTLSTKMAITSAGNVGIGTDSPSSRLHVNSGGTNIVAQFESTDGTSGIMLKDSTGNVELTTSATNGFNVQPAGGTAAFVVTGSGNVGIGTTSPSYKLDVSDGVNASETAAINLNGNNGAAAELIMRAGGNDGGTIYNRRAAIRYYSNQISTTTAQWVNGVSMTQATGDDNFYFNNSGNSTVLKLTQASEAVFGGNIYLPQSPGAIQGTGYPYTTYLGSAANATTTYIQAGSTFKTEIKLVGGDVGDFINFTAGNTERMRITSGGNVGIGNTSPTHQMHIHTDNDNTYALRIEGSTNNGAGVWTGIGIAGESANTKSAIIFQDIGVSYARGKLLFCVNNDENQNSASPSDARMTISNNGNVGIGVSNPQFEKLEVAGNIKANDVNGKFYTNAYSFANADTYSDTVSVSGHCLYEYIIEVNPNSAGSGLYADYYYGKVGIGVGWNGSAVTQYIFQNADETAPRSLYPSGGSNISITTRMIYSGGVYTELAQGTTCTIRFQGFGTSNYGIIYLRRLA